MRLRITDRILVGITGLLLLALCAGLAAQIFFHADLLGLATRVLTSKSPRVQIALILLTVVFLLLGVYCVLVLFRHHGRKDRFVIQKNEDGELAISMKALENMVQKCLEQHQELQVEKTQLENRKDGVLIRIYGNVAGGISIPLTVEGIQKQIRQYVTACSGVEVKGIRVQIESSREDVTDAPFAIAAPAATPLLRETSEKQPALAKPEASEPVPETPAADSRPTEAVTREASPVHTPIPEPEEPDDPPDDRPLHQRLFSIKPEPCIVPEPPEDAGKEQISDNRGLNDPEDGEGKTDGCGEAETVSGTDQSPETGSHGSAETETEENHGSAEPDLEFRQSLKDFDEIISGTKEDR